MANFKPGTDFWSLSDASFTPDCCYGPRGLSTAYNVLQALRKIGREIQDLRFPTMNDPCYPGKLLPKTLRWVLPETLCTLHMSFDWFNFECYNRATFNYTDHSGSFLSALENIHIHENLALCLAGCIVCEVEQTTQLFQAIRKTSKLRRLDLKGRWIILPTDLIIFAEQHALILRHLVLEYCCLEGTFLSTIHSLAAITRDHLQYLRMWNIEAPYTSPSNEFLRISLDTYTHSQWPKFNCVTDFGPRFQLLPDLNRESDNVL